VIALCTAGYALLIASPFGLALRGIKGSESRMRSLGYAPGRHLYAAFVISGTLAGIAGVLYVHYNRFVNPVSASFPISVEAALMVILGGTGTILGPFLGSALILSLRNWVSSFFDHYNTVLGVVFIATVLWAPHGIVGLAQRVFGLGSRRTGDAAAGDRG
jgi:branched-chain amino acid transport system permease protein